MASALSLGTPSPASYMYPRRACARGFPCSARGFNNKKAAFQSPRSSAARPSSKAPASVPLPPTVDLACVASDGSCSGDADCADVPEGGVAAMASPVRWSIPLDWVGREQQLTSKTSMVIDKNKFLFIY